MGVLQRFVIFLFFCGFWWFGVLDVKCLQEQVRQVIEVFLHQKEKSSHITSHPLAFWGSGGLCKDPGIPQTCISLEPLSIICL